MGYFGSKATSGLCQPLIAMMPPHDTYIETHLGGGAIMRRKPAALHNIGIDRDARALGEFECDYRVELIHGCAHRFLSEYAFEGSELLYSDPPYGRTLPECLMYYEGNACSDRNLCNWQANPLTGALCSGRTRVRRASTTGPSGLPLCCLTLDGGKLRDTGAGAKSSAEAGRCVNRSRSICSFSPTTPSPTSPTQRQKGDRPLIFRS